MVLPVLVGVPAVVGDDDRQDEFEQAGARVGREEEPRLVVVAVRERGREARPRAPSRPWPWAPPSRPSRPRGRLLKGGAQTAGSEQAPRAPVTPV